MSAGGKSTARLVLEKVGLVSQDPKELLREWQKELRHEQLALDRQLRAIEREENGLKRELKQLAKKGEREAMRPLASALLKSGKAKERIQVFKANINSVLLDLRMQTAQLRMAQTLQSSTTVMASMNRLMSSSAMRNNLRDMAVEMERAGLIEEMMSETLDGAFDDVEAEADQEVDKVISELTLGILSGAPAAPRAELAESGKRLFQESLSEGGKGDAEGRVLVGAEEDEEGGGGATAALESRMAALRA